MTVISVFELNYSSFFSGFYFAISVALSSVSLLCLLFLSSLVPLHLPLITSLFGFRFIFASLSVSLIAPPPRFYFSLFLLLSLFHLSFPGFSYFTFPSPFFDFPVFVFSVTFL